MAVSLADQITGTGLINPVDPGIFLNGPAPGLSVTPASQTAANSLFSDALSTNPYSLLNAASSFLSGFGNSLGSGSSFSDAATSGINSATNTAYNSASADSFWTDIFLRAVIIILGFIFTAIGLSMFGNKAATVVINETKRSFGK